MKKAKPGDQILVKKIKGQEKGILLESHEQGEILLKLKTGYNIGINKDNIKQIEIIKEAEKEEQEEKIKMKGKPIIDFYLTGGTISSKLDPKTGGVKDLTSPNEFFKTYPEINEIVDLRIKKPFTKWSENMDSEDWVKLAKQIEK